MYNPQDATQTMQDLIREINKIIRKHHSGVPFKNQDIAGLIILQFPKDHHKEHMVHQTFLGKVCTSCAMRCIIDTYITYAQGENPLAT